MSGLSNQMIPLLTAENQLTDMDWKYQTEPSDGYCCEMYNERRQQMARGKVAGGSAVSNYMMWMRGHKEDWNSIFNIDEWKWDNVLPYFQKTESLHRAHNKKCTNVRGRGCNGPVIVNDARNLLDKNNIFDEAVLNAFLSTKKFKFLKHGQNSVTGSNVGAGYTEYNIDDNGHRNNAFLAYNKYLRTKYRKEYADSLINLDILTNAHVTKILFDDNDTKNDDKLIRANGVEFAHLNDNKKLYSVHLTDTNGKNSEIILAGGSINNPQILMLSGLGPSDQLQKHKIPVVKDIPGIGENLQDHSTLFIRYHFNDEYKNEAITDDRVQMTLNNFTVFKDYLFEGKSILSTAAGNVGGFIRSHVMNAKYGTKHNYPDLQIVILPGFHGFEQYFNLKKEYFIEYECGKPEYFSDKANMMNILAVVILLHPESKGWIKLKSSNPFDYPLIQPNYLKEQFDVDVLMEGYKIIDEIMYQPSMKQMWDEKIYCKKYGNIVNNNTNLEKYIRDSVTLYDHPIGTCKMGNIVKDKMAVVDNKLLVRGTMNLRIADASIYPYQTSGNTQVPTYMVGEKASDIILQAWNS
eukprot:527924_1